MNKEIEICIYGATSGGVIAAYVAAKQGHSVILIEPGSHLGGMSSGGLGWTDYGEIETIGGITRKFFDPELGGVGRLSGDKVSGWNNIWALLPSDTEKKFADLLAETSVEILFNCRINRSGKGVTKAESAIKSIHLEDGTSISASAFIDASYEGDLLAEAGVSWRNDREPYSEYQEPCAGVIGDQLPDQFRIPQLFEYPVDPYIVPGDQSSGLLPGIQKTSMGEAGSGDDKIQAYCYRSCLTLSNDPSKRIEITEPEDYDPLNFELLRRNFIAAREAGHELRMDEVLKVSPLPEDKTDINARGPMSIDFIGESWNYTEASYEERKAIDKQHELYTKGLFWFLKTDEAVSPIVRKEMAQFAYPADEYLDNGGWSHQLYVRESRRMIGEFIMTQHHVGNGSPPVEKSIGMGSYSVDSHHVQRCVIQDEHGKDIVQNEGNFLYNKYPYSIPLEAILPKQEECSNLIITFCVSSSHVAFSSVRMEPVLMILSESAAHVASLALSKKQAIHELDYALIRKTLLDADQILELNP